MQELVETPMVSKKELTDLSGKALQKLIADATALQQERRDGTIQEIRERWQKEAEEEGLSVLDILGIKQEQPIAKRGRPKGNGARTPAKAKYRLPDGTDWSGKGRLPLTLRDALKGSEGYSEEDASFDSKEARAAALAPYLIEKA